MFWAFQNETFFGALFWGRLGGSRTSVTVWNRFSMTLFLGWLYGMPMVTRPHWGQVGCPACPWRPHEPPARPQGDRGTEWSTGWGADQLGWDLAGEKSCWAGLTPVWHLPGWFFSFIVLGRASGTRDLPGRDATRGPVTTGMPYTGYRLIVILGTY